MTAPYEHLRALVDHHGLIAVLSTLVTVCEDCAGSTPEGVTPSSTNLCWKMARGLVKQAKTRLSDLRDVPGITGPAETPAYRPLEAPESPDEALGVPVPPPSSPGA